MQVLISNYQIPATSWAPATRMTPCTCPTSFDVKLLPRRTLGYSDNGGFDLTIDHLPRRRRLTSLNSVSFPRTAISAQGRWRSRRDLRCRVHQVLPPPGIALITVRTAETGASATPRTPPQWVALHHRGMGFSNRRPARIVPAPF